MVDKGVEPNAIAFCAMIDTCAKAGNLVRAEYWYEKMLQRGIAPDAHIYSAVINACANTAGPGSAESAEMWLDRAEQGGLIDQIVYSSVINACGKVGDIARALRVFQRMRANALKPQVVAYSSLALSYARRGNWQQVESISQDMMADGVAVNEYFAYAQLLSYANCRQKKAQRAENYFRHVLGAGVEANDHIVQALTRCVGSQRCVTLLRELLGDRETPKPPPPRARQAGAIRSRCCSGSNCGVGWVGVRMSGGKPL